MDLLTTAIIAAVGKLADMAVKDGYEKLKTVIAKKLGDNNEVVVAAEKLEMKPDSDGRRQTLQEEVSAAGLDGDEDIAAAAARLVDIIKALPDGEQTITQTVTGDHNIFSGTGDITINRD